MSVTGMAHIADDADGAAEMAADFLQAHIASSTGIFRLVLTGGSTARKLYERLSEAACAQRIPWSRVELFWGDERFVSWDHADSNFRMARDTLLANPLVAPRGIYPITTDTTPEDSAARYETTLKEYYGASVINPDRPLFDCVLLGLGADGHVASLLPHQPVLEEKSKWVAPVPEGRETTRITLTYTALESCRILVFLVTGQEKAEAVERVRARDTNLPGGRLRPSGETVWFLDSAAATPR